MISLLFPYPDSYTNRYFRIRSYIPVRSKSMRNSSLIHEWTIYKSTICLIKICYLYEIKVYLMISVPAIRVPPKFLQQKSQNVAIVFDFFADCGTLEVVYKENISYSLRSYWHLVLHSPTTTNLQHMKAIFKFCFSPC